MTVFETDPRLATRFGVIACAVLGVLGVFALVVALAIPASLVTFGCLLVALGAGLAVVFLLYQLRGLRSLSYSLDRNSFVIRWGEVREIIPMAEAQRVIAGSEIRQGLRVRRVPLPGWWVGVGRHPALGEIHFYSNDDLDRQSIIVTPDKSFAVSSLNPEAFDDAFNQRLAMRPTQDVQYARIVPGLRSTAAFRDHLAQGLILAAIVVFLGLTAYAFAVYPGLPRALALHYNSLGLPDRFGAASSIFSVVAIALAALAGNAVLGVIAYRLGEKLGAYLAWAGGIFVQIAFALAALSIVART
ncbi:MAG: PH domain-containing protein [Thermoflexales bacterium]|nr:PH domain-containing protein [Thermoflexales bacterium]